LFDSAELSKFTADERAKYQLEMTTERDIHNQIVYARDKGLEEGLEQGRAEGREEGRAEGAREQAVESARYFLRLGLTNEDVAKGTGLTVEEVEALRKGD
jgi:predicted transposase/invertase (TIGR01784 family)